MTLGTALVPGQRGEGQIVPYIFFAGRHGTFAGSARCQGMTHDDWRRRDFLTLAGLGGLVFSSGLVGCGSVASGPRTGAAVPNAGRPSRTGADFFFLQLSDTHWGFEGAPNPEAALCLKQTVGAINEAETQPDFIVFTGDLTHKTDDAKERRARLRQFREIVGELRTKKLVFLPGEHDAAADAGDAYRETFGALYGSFDHHGVRFIALDNASAPGGALGAVQLEWLANEVAKVPTDAPLVVLAHRPLFDLYPEWEWATADGLRALDVLSRHENVTVFYGHIHQENHHTIGNITHHSARSLIFPLPAPGASPQRAPLPWDPASRDHGLGHRSIQFANAAKTPVLTEIPFIDAAAAAPPSEACNGAPPSYPKEVRPVLEERCFGCHTGSGSAADDHDFSTLERVLAERHDIGRQVSARAMPPASKPRLRDDEAALLVRWAACAGS